MHMVCQDVRRTGATRNERSNQSTLLDRNPENYAKEHRNESIPAAAAGYS
jgi:hypothetical protein